MPQLTLSQLRAQHPRFIYQSVSAKLQGQNLEVEFEFVLEPDIIFHPRLVFPKIDLAAYQKLDQQVIQQWLFRIGLVELLSYWKMACSPEIVITAGYLDEQEIIFWQKLLHKGLSEFFFVNQIDAWQTDFVNFVITGQQTTNHIDQQTKKHRALIPLGGGKDSVVTVETLKKVGTDNTLFFLNPSIASQRVSQVTQITQQIQVFRTLDPQLIKLNESGYLNGHTPFSALLAFISTFAAYIFDFDQVILSNEWSANEANIVFQGQEINHQYSKSYEFEADFRQYIAKHLSTTVSYFSLLRPLHELQIANLFSRHSEYFGAFLSCNRGSNQGKWCGNCAKCVFAAIILAPFVSPSQLQTIFGYDILNNEKLLPILDELAGVVELKSLDCVGTRDETKAALFYALQKYPTDNLPILLQYAKDQIVKNQSADQAQQILTGYQQQNFLPKELDQLLHQEVTT